MDGMEKVYTEQKEEKPKICPWRIKKQTNKKLKLKLDFISDMWDFFNSHSVQRVSKKTSSGGILSIFLHPLIHFFFYTNNC